MEKKWEDINDPSLDEIVDVNMDGDAYANRDEETEQEDLEAGNALAEQLEARRAKAPIVARGPEGV
jgi:hypothetical protein